MPVDRFGNTISVLHGDSAPEQLLNKIIEMRKELQHMDRALMALELQTRRGVPAQGMRQNASNLFNWTLSAMESFCQISKLAFGRDMMDRVVADFRSKLRIFGF